LDPTKVYVQSTQEQVVTLVEQTLDVKLTLSLMEAMFEA